MCRFNDNLFTVRSHRAAFTLVEVGAALVLLSIILSSVMVLMNRYVDSVIDLQLRQEAFELARGNMEELLAESKLSDMAEGPETRIPWVGEHTDDVLRAELGLDAHRLAALRAEGVIT